MKHKVTRTKIDPPAHVLTGETLHDAIVREGYQTTAKLLRRRWYKPWQYIWPWKKRFEFDYIILGTDKK